MLDPLGSGYYFLGIEGPALVGLAVFVTSERCARLREPRARERRAAAPI